MPQPDPLNNIMSMLRRSGSIDPGTSQARQARMAVDRRQMGPGVAPTAQRGERPPVGASMPQAGMQPEVAGQGQELAQGQDMTSIMIDQMNEIILSGKIQIHREQDRDRRRMLEGQLETIRQQILQLGGEPIWADESIEEGLQKIQGYGAVGAPQINEQLNQDIYGANLNVPSVGQPNVLGDVLSGIGAAKTDDIYPRRDSGVGIRAYVEGAGGQVDWSESDPLAAIIRGPVGQQRVEFSELFEDTGYAPEDTVRQAMMSAGISLMPQVGADIRIGDQVISMPTESGLGDYRYTVDTLKLAGIDLDTMMTEREWEDYKVASVQKAMLSQRQIVQRELDRFQDSFPNEFEQAKKNVEEWAGTQKAVSKEDLAGRGMYFSSLMGNALAEIDTKALEVIGDIAKEAAVHEADLRRQLSDIDALEVLEIEIARFEARAEFFEQRTMLAKMMAEVQYQRDQLALQEFSLMSDRYMDVYREESKRIQQEYDQMRETQQVTALGMWAMRDPFISQHINAAGLGTAFAQMDPYQQAYLVDSLVNIVIPLRQNEEKHKLDTAYTTAQIATEQARANAIGIETELMQMDVDYKKSIQGLKQKYASGEEITQDEILRLTRLGEIQADPQSVSILDVMNALTMFAEISLDESLINSPVGESIQAALIQIVDTYSRMQTPTGDLDNLLQIVKDGLSNIAKGELPPGEAYTQKSLWETYRDWAEKYRKEIYFEITKDPTLTQEAKIALLKKRMPAMPTAEQIERWEAEYKREGAQSGTSKADEPDVVLGKIIQGP